MSSDSGKAQTDLPVTIVGEGRDESGKRYFKFAINGSQQDLRPFSVDEIVDDPDKLYKELSNSGANVFTPTVKSALLHHLQNRRPEAPSFKVVTKLGWTDGRFVLPDGVIGTSKLPIEVVLSELDRQMLAKYRCKGTLKQWQDNIGSLCAGNSRLMFAVSLALTGPILPYVKGVRSGGFQITGPGETGKTTAMMVCGSVWGCHLSSERQEKGFAESWHTTAGKVEVTALAHNESVLLLDETKRAGKNDQARAEAVIDISFSLAEGAERQRLNQGPPRAWRFYFLSTSNFALLELAKHVEITDAELGRLPDIPCPAGKHGIYETLHDYADGAALTDELKSRCRKFFGAPAQVFVEKLVAEVEQHPGRVQTFLRRRRKRYLLRIAAKAKTVGIKPLNRASSRFATVYAAGCLAIRYGLLRWDRNDLLKAILSCQLDGMRLTTDASVEAEPTVDALKDRLVQYIRGNRSQFLDLDQERLKSGADFEAAPGYAATVLEPAEKTIVHIPSVNSRESTKDKIREVEHIIEALGDWQGADPTTGFQLVKRPDGRVLKIADLVDDDSTKRDIVSAALKEPTQKNNRDYVDIIIALGMAKEGFDWIWCEHALTVGYRSSLTEIVQIIGRATRDAPGKTRARFTNLIAEPDASEEAVTEAVNDTLKAIAASLLMEQVLAPRFNFTPKNPQSGPVEGFDYGQGGYDPNKGNVGFNEETGQFHIEIKGLAEPKSKEAARICSEDLNEVIAAFVQDKTSIERGLFDEELIPEELTQVRMGKIIKDKYPDLNEEDQEAVRQHAIAALTITQRAKQIALGDGGTGGDNTDKVANTALIDGVRKFAMDVRELDIDLIDRINPFGEAYAILAKTMSEESLKQVAAAIAAKRTSLTPDEAKELAVRAARFKKERGRLPSIDSQDAWERRMAEGAVAFMRFKKEGRYGG